MVNSVDIRTAIRSYYDRCSFLMIINVISYVNTSFIVEIVKDNFHKYGKSVSILEFQGYPKMYGR